MVVGMLVAIVVVVSVVIVPTVDVVEACEHVSRFDLATIVNRAMSWIVNMSGVAGISISNL